MKNYTISEEAKELMQDCIDTYGMCLETITYTMLGQAKGKINIKLFFDCADICKKNANLILANTDYYKQISILCSQLCEEVSRECAKFENDPQFNACAEITSHCAKNCRIVTKTDYYEEDILQNQSIL